MAGVEVPVVVVNKEFPGLKLRFLVDRDAGVLLWEDQQLDDNGNAFATQHIRLGLPHLVALEEIFAALIETRDLFTPRRRLDLAQFDRPGGFK